MTVTDTHGSCAVWAPLTEPPEPWRFEAACLWMSIDQAMATFFPPAGKTDRSVIYDRAREVCDSCPVADECLNDAVAKQDIYHGFRGGLSAWERRKVWDRRRRG